MHAQELTCAADSGKVLASVGWCQCPRFCAFKEIIFHTCAVDASQGCQVSHLFTRYISSYIQKGWFTITWCVLSLTPRLCLAFHHLAHISVLHKIKSWEGAWEQGYCFLPSPTIPRCLQATAASLSSQSSPHTGVHVELRQYCTSPSKTEDPLNKRITPTCSPQPVKTVLVNIFRKSDLLERHVYCCYFWYFCMHACTHASVHWQYNHP